jgi:O-antigen/teichoic acid export membrane protein
VVALTSVAAPFATWGSGNLLVKHTARDRDAFSFYWARALTLTPISGALLACVVVAVGRVIFGARIPLVVLCCVALSDLLLIRLVDACALAFQALDRLRLTAMMQFLPALTKLLAAVGVLAFGSGPTLLSWAVVYLLAASAAALIAGLWTWNAVEKPSFGGVHRAWEWREGLYFSISLASQTLYNDIDKTFLVRLATSRVAGIYAAAYRLIDVAIVPVRSVLAASYTRFFRSGQKGLDGSIAQARQLLPIGVIYGSLVGATIWAGSNAIVWVLGSDFGETASVLRWLALLPLLKVLSSLPADALTGADKQARRSAIQAGVGILNIVLNVVLISRYSWHGAAWASLISDATLAALLWSAALVLRRQATQGSKTGMARRPVIEPIPEMT